MSIEEMLKLMSIVIKDLDVIKFEDDSDEKKEDEEDAREKEPEKKPIRKIQI